MTNSIEVSSSSNGKASARPSKRRSKGPKPKKPYSDFPLFAHANGQWCKKIRGKHVHFGTWDDPDAALKKYLDQRDDLQAGRTPRVQSEGLTVAALCNKFLTSKEHFRDSGEITNRTFLDYHATCRKLIEEFGNPRLVEDLASDDFEALRRTLASTRGPRSLGSEVQRVRCIFRYAHDAHLIDRPARFGPNFKRPSRAVLRKDRNEKGPKMLEADEIHKLLAAADPTLRAMILLGVNCGFGNSDCGRLPKSALDLDGGWIDYPRPKTGINRRCPLWPETAEALREAQPVRPTPESASDDRLVFLTKRGLPFATDTTTNPISNLTHDLMRNIGIHKPGRGFYTLRHVFETIAGESRDQVAVDHIMGHARDDMASVYRERISDERLKAVTDVVHEWLFAEQDT